LRGRGGKTSKWSPARVLSILLLALSWGLCFVLSIPPSGRTGNFACRIPAAGEMHRHAARGSPKLWCFVVHSRGIGLLCACALGSSSESSNRTKLGRRWSRQLNSTLARPSDSGQIRICPRSNNILGIARSRMSVLTNLTAYFYNLPGTRRHVHL
jgi:hypothetical protein